MAYSVGGRIEAADYNGFSSSINAAWAVGAADSGYGQTAIGTVTAGNPVLAAEWSAIISIISALNAMSQHQVGGAAPITGANFPATGVLPVAGATPPAAIAWGNNVVSTIATVNTTQRLNAALQGAPTSTTNTSTVTWNDFLQYAWTVTFASHNQARYFFNAGGQIAFTASHPAGAGIDSLLSDLCSDAGTVILSSTNGTPASVSIAGTAYNGITKVGGSNPGGVTISPATGFYALTPAPASVFKQTSDLPFPVYGAATNYEILASYNGTGVIALTVRIDQVPTPGIAAAIGTVSTLIVRPPDTTHLANTWGVPVIACTRTSA